MADPVKVLCFLKRKPGSTHQQFMDYYENNHAPLITRLLPFYHGYRRNFLRPSQNYDTRHLDNKIEAEPDFDVVTELTFETQKAYQKMVDALNDPAISAEITADESKFMDRTKMAVYIVDERGDGALVRRWLCSSPAILG